MTKMSVLGCVQRWTNVSIPKLYMPLLVDVLLLSLDTKHVSFVL